MFGFSFLRRKSAPRRTLHVVGDDRTAPIEPGETLLGAAVRGKIPFPHLCNVGKCGACKCRLTKGHVRLQRDISRRVSDEELSAGWVLACQSQAVSDDVEVEVPKLSRRRSAKPAPVQADATMATTK